MKRNASKIPPANLVPFYNHSILLTLAATNIPSPNIMARWKATYRSPRWSYRFRGNVFENKRSYFFQQCSPPFPVTRLQLRNFVECERAPNFSSQPSHKIAKRWRHSDERFTILNFFTYITAMQTLNCSHINQHHGADAKAHYYHRRYLIAKQTTLLHKYTFDSTQVAFHDKIQRVAWVFNDHSPEGDRWLNGNLLRTHVRYSQT